MLRVSLDNISRHHFEEGSIDMSESWAITSKYYSRRAALNQYFKEGVW